MRMKNIILLLILILLSTHGRKTAYFHLRFEVINHGIKYPGHFIAFGQKCIVI